MTTVQQSPSSLPSANGVSEETFLQVRDLKMHFPVTEGAIVQKIVAHVKAVDGVSFDIRRGETLGLVGESGCGKTTVGRCILQLEHATEGEIMFEGQNLTKLRPERTGTRAGKNPSHLSGPLQLVKPAYEDRHYVGRTHACPPYYYRRQQAKRASQRAFVRLWTGS